MAVSNTLGGRQQQQNAMVITDAAGEEQVKLSPQIVRNYLVNGSAETVTEQEIVDYPFSSEHPPVEITAPLYQIDWGYEEGYNDLCGKVPHSREPISETMPVKMKPYGCTNLRMTELPKF